MLTKPCIKKSLEKHRWWLNSGRQRDQWHTMTRTGHIVHLSASEVEPTVYINRLDAENANLKPDNLIAIRQGDNQLKAKLAIDDNLTHGQAFMSMHWAGEYGKTSQVNRVLKGVVDPHSGQPAFKSQAISIYAQTVASYGISTGINFTLKHWDYLSLQHVQFQTGMQTQAKAGSTTSNFQKGIWRFAHSIAISKAEIQAQIKATHPRCKFLSLDHEQGWSMAGLVNDKVVSVISVNDQPLKLAAEALISLINQPLNLTQLLSALSSNQSQNSKLICSCFRVTEADILQVLEERTSVSLAELQTTLKCGTNCGSCLPEVNRYLQTQKIDVLAVK
nr:molybdopterin dinucleotide binding domain-containing protein [Vibrio algicola]